MNILLTGDWQTEWANLDLCNQARTEVFEILKREKLDGVYFLGDLKKHYDPIQTSVIQFWHDFIGELYANDYYVGIVLGNHDRIGQYDDKKNWLSILAKAGAEVFDEPYHMGNIFILPWNRDVKALKHQLHLWGKRKKTHDERDILLFHTDIKNTKYNQLGRKSDAKLTVEDFHSSRYLACIGGHIHLHQKLGENIYYTGSPFCTDWGEANQRKGYMLVKDGKVRFVASRIPSWYDESWPGFYPPDNVHGSRIRVHCKCDSTRNYGQVIEQARKQAFSKYPGATIFVEPEFLDSDAGSAIIKATDHDDKKIQAYVEQTCPDNLRKDAKRLAKYLTIRLNSVTSKARSVDGVKFISASAKNFLSFKEVECVFTNKGIVVVDGINQDRPGSSNGAGKTSFLQLLPVALFGTTFKGQKYDRWARRNAKALASVKLVFRDARGKAVHVTRTRHPSKLRLNVNHVDESSGLRSDSRDATQGRIEQVSGYTWATLANSVYIDPSVARAFLSGRKAERSQVLARFQNLERFTKAQELVKKDVQLNDENYEHVNLSLHDVEARIEEIKDYVVDLEEQLLAQRVNLATDLRDKEVELSDQKKIYSKWINSTASKRSELAQFEIYAEEKIQLYMAKAYKASAQKNHLLSSINRLSDLGNECPTCKQAISLRYSVALSKPLRKRLKAVSIEFDKCRSVAEKHRRESAAIKQRLEELDEKDRSISETIREQENDIARIKREARAHSGKTRIKDSLRAHNHKLNRLKAEKTLVEKSLRYFEKMRKFYDYCREAFSRDGIPAFLSHNMVPYLNKEADFYSELFCDKAIQIRFEVVNGEFEVNTINATGGDSTDDQSTGEQACAGLIASFALRSVAPRCNVLILDEPGAGLDERSVRQFAKGLRQLKDRFGTIFITTHNQTLLSELGQEKTITIEKKKGISRVQISA